MSDRARVLVFGIGNPARGDDVLGVCLIERVQAYWPHIDVLEVFQLQIEHVLDLCGVDLVLFCDAAIGLTQGCQLREVQAGQARLAFSHAMPPQALLHVFFRVHGRAPPPAFVLAMRAENMGLGETLSATGEQSLEAAWSLVQRLLAEPSAEAWRRQVRTGFSST